MCHVVATRTFGLLFALSVVVSLAVPIGIFCIAWHFIAKFW